MSEVEIWGQRSDESSQAWSAFKAFRDLGAGRQPLAAYRLAKGRPEASATPGTWNAWIVKYDWYSRARAYDQYLDRAKTEAAAETARLDGEMWQRRRAELPGQLYAVATTLLKRAYDAARAEGATSGDVRRSAAAARDATVILKDAISTALPDPETFQISDQDRIAMVFHGMTDEDRARVRASLKRWRDENMADIPTSPPQANAVPINHASRRTAAEILDGA